MNSVGFSGVFICCLIAALLCIFVDISVKHFSLRTTVIDHYLDQVIGPNDMHHHVSSLLYFLLLQFHALN